MARLSRRGATPSRLFKLMGKKSRSREFLPLEQEEEAMKKSSASPKEAETPPASESCEGEARSHPWDKHLPSSSGSPSLKKKLLRKVFRNNEEEASSIEEGESVDADSCGSGNLCSGDEELDATTYKTNSDESESSGDEHISPKSPTSIIDFVSLSPDTSFKDSSEAKREAYAYSDDETDGGSSLKEASHFFTTSEKSDASSSSIDKDERLDKSCEILSPEGPPQTHLSQEDCATPYSSTSEEGSSHRHVAHVGEASESRPPLGLSPEHSALVDGITQVPAPSDNADVPFDEIPFDEMPLDEMPLDEIPFDELGPSSVAFAANKGPTIVRGFHGSPARKQTDIARDFKNISVSRDSKQNEDARGFNELNFFTLRKRRDSFRGSNALNFTSTNKQPDAAQGPSVANKQPDLLHETNGASAAGALAVNGANVAVVDRPLDEEIPFDELEEPLYRFQAESRKYNFEDKTYFSDDDGDSLRMDEVYVEKSIGSLVSADDDSLNSLFGLELLDHI